MIVKPAGFVDLEVYPSMVVTRAYIPGVCRDGGGRGEIGEFSQAARRRMLDFLHKIHFEKALLVTLTYDAEYPTDSKVYHAHLAAFRKCYERAYGKDMVVWRLEFQRREAPHFHLVVDRGDYVDIKKLSEDWHRISGCKSVAHLAAGLDVKSVSDCDGVHNVGAYVCKYISKTGDTENEHGVKKAGRFWGVWNRPKTGAVRLKIAPWDVERVVRVIMGHMGIENVPYAGFDPLNGTLYTGAAGSFDPMVKILELLSVLGYDGEVFGL